MTETLQAGFPSIEQAAIVADLISSDGVAGSLPFFKAIAAFSEKVKQYTGIRIVKAVSTTTNGLHPEDSFVDNKLSTDQQLQPFVSVSRTVKFAEHLSGLPPSAKLTLDFMCPPKKNIDDTIDVVLICFQKYYSSFLVKRRTYFRSLAVQGCLDCNDTTALARKIKELTRIQVKCDGICIFTSERGGTIIGLQVASSIRAGLSIKDVRYNLARDANSLTRSFISGSMIEMQPEDERVVDKTYPERPYQVHNQYFIPISRQPSNVLNDSGRTSLGVLRITNVRGTIEGPTPGNSRRLTWEDVYILNFMAELYYVLLNGFFAADTSRHKYERAVHAIDFTADSTLKLVRELRAELYPEAIGSDEVTGFDPNSTKPQLHRLLKSPFNRLLAIEAFAEDMNDQILLNSGFSAFTISSSDRSGSQTNNIVNEVLRPIVRMGPRLSAFFYSKNPPVFVTNLTEAVQSELKRVGLDHMPPVTGLPSHITSVFRNLLDNSIKYTSGRNVSIEIGIAIDEEFVCIRWADKGIGISKDEAVSIFDDGYRSIRAENLANKGLGIGLTVSKEILDFYGGDIEVSSAEVGSVFFVKLKRHK